jgi:hypothetical protein
MALNWACYWIKANLEDGDDADVQINPRFHISQNARDRFKSKVESIGDGEFVVGKSPIQVHADSMEVDFLDDVPKQSSFLDFDDGDDVREHHFATQSNQRNGRGMFGDMFGDTHRQTPNEFVNEERNPSKGDDFGWL